MGNRRMDDRAGDETSRKRKEERPGLDRGLEEGGRFSGGNSKD